VSRYVDEHRERFGVEPICRTLGVSVSAYYPRRSGRRSARAIEDDRLLGRIRELHAANYYAYGYRRMWKALRRAGEQVPRCRVQRLMRANGMVGAKRRGKPWRITKPDTQAGRRPDLVQRDFAAIGPNELWVADISYRRCWEGLVFFAFVLDAYSRMIVGWQLASHMRTDLVLDALKMALQRRGPGADVELIHHSDRGSQYTSIDYTQTLADHQVLASVGSVGDAYDNALAESFLDSFKTELIADRVWRSRSQLELAVVERPCSTIQAGTTPPACTGASATSRQSSTSRCIRPKDQLRSPRRSCDPTNPVPVEPVRLTGHDPPRGGHR
jgi:putative transposase